MGEKKIKTVKEAMELAINEHHQYMQWAKGEKDNKQENYIKRNRFARKYCPIGLIKMKIKTASEKVSRKKQ